MSSTNRANAAQRHVSDYYVTPIASIKDFLDAFRKDFPVIQDANTLQLYGRGPYPDDMARGHAILDPCAGGDLGHEMSYPWAIEKYSGWNYCRVETVDIREDSNAEVIADYLNWTPTNKYSVIITNPPFNIALDVIKKARQEVMSGGFVIMLLRLNFFGSQKRSEWFKENMPNFVYVHSKRMRFTNTPGTDSIEYQHSIWIKDKPCRFSRLRVI